MASALRPRDAGGIERLFFYLSRFRDAIEADLAFRGVSLKALWGERRWRELLNLINHLPPNSHFNEALTSDREVMVAMARIEEKRREAGVESEKPTGPRVSQVSEEARRLGEVVSSLRYLAKVVIAASPKSKGQVGKYEPYPQPVMIDGKTGNWIGKPTEGTLKKNHKRRVQLAQEAAARWQQTHGE